MMARQFAEVMNQNFKRSEQAAQDGFFGPAGDQVTEAIMMLARGTDFPDLMMCQALASRTDLAHQIIKQKDKLNPWVLASFGQLISSAESEKTVSSILATANINFTRFMKADVLPAFCGQTTIPTFLEGKQLLVLGLDREKRDVLAPLIAAILHLLVNRNVSRPRSDPLFLMVDEVPTLYLPALHHWLNENREDGLSTVLGFQNLVQMEKMYGKDLAGRSSGAVRRRSFLIPKIRSRLSYFLIIWDSKKSNSNKKVGAGIRGKPIPIFLNKFKPNPSLRLRISSNYRQVAVFCSIPILNGVRRLIFHFWSQLI